ncbi:guanylate cyclase domain-containing protein [Haematococcus lacustris]|uniref:Guanylate cyclase domain-containing protein n=1 Tax=Haematococcus lacustris TaxID=44745 RepID=A0A699YS83_HAELA|nr:guanylate cyclase domain-containing protein [Haematococcus lacustris]
MGGRRGVRVWRRKRRKAMWRWAGYPAAHIQTKSHTTWSSQQQVSWVSQYSRLLKPMVSSLLSECYSNQLVCSGEQGCAAALVILPKANYAFGPRSTLRCSYVTEQVWSGCHQGNVTLSKLCLHAQSACRTANAVQQMRAMLDASQGYTKLLKTLGSTIVELMANLNNLHLHLSNGQPAMDAPAFRVDNVTEVSCHLHYYSNRRALWPIVVGVLKGLSKQYLKYDLTVELLQSRDGGHDHEVFLVGYPRQTLSNRVNNCGDSQPEAAAAVSPCAFTLSPDLFAELHPFHLLLDSNCSVLQACSWPTHGIHMAYTWHTHGHGRLPPTALPDPLGLHRRVGMTKHALIES